MGIFSQPNNFAYQMKRFPQVETALKFVDLCNKMVIASKYSSAVVALFCAANETHLRIDAVFREPEYAMLVQTEREKKQEEPFPLLPALLDGVHFNQIKEYFGTEIGAIYEELNPARICDGGLVTLRMRIECPNSMRQYGKLKMMLQNFYPRAIGADVTDGNTRFSINFS